MNKKSLVMFVAAAFLIQLFCVTALAAAEGPSLTVELDEAAGAITVAGSGYASGQMLSVMGYNGADLDYIDQISAGADGSFVFTYKANTELRPWTAGNIIKVLINGLAAEAVIAPDGPSIKIDYATPTIVEGYSANLAVSVSGRNLPDGAVIEVTLTDGETVYASGTADAEGEARLRLPSAPAGKSCYYLAAVKGTGLQATAPIEIVPLPEDIWSPKLIKNADNNLDILFGHAVTEGAAFGVMIGDKSADYSVDGAIVRTGAAYDGIDKGVKVVVKGVKFMSLFPSYSFTFTVSF